MTAIVVIGLFILAAIRLRPLIRKGSDTVFMAAVVEGVGMGINIDAVYTWLDPLLGGQNLTNLISHILVIGGLWFLRSAILDSVAPEAGSIYRITSILPLTATLVAHAVLFFLSDLPVTAASFNETYGDQTTVAMYTCLSMLYIAWVTAETGLACLRYVPQMRASFRVGFTVLGAGCAAAMTAALSQIIFVMGKHFDFLAPLGDVTATLYETCQSLSILLIGIGLIIPPAAASVTKRRTDAWHRQANEKMAAIWDRLREVTKERQSLPVDTISGSELTYRLLVEIRDSQLMAGEASPLTDEELAYVDEVEGKLDVVPAR
ncbi:hypothetical protein [Arthrobacter sp. H14]|uniref:hypothetical protein n=1 Tax=Arthrobacter sp. H14 TaxID=1312959 RepID=UPI000479AEBA|nr:hypothetical protein [Arthrobacter sp. H14]